MCLAVPLRLIDISDDRLTGTVDAGGSPLTVGLELVPTVEVGDFVLVHAGMAIEVLDEAEAEETLRLYREFIEASDLLEPKKD